MTIRLRELLLGLRSLKLGDTPVVVHASLASFGEVEEAQNAVVGALAVVFKSILMPTFTYKTMVTPRVGPPQNGLVYGSGKDQNRMAEFFTPRMPADRLMGIIPETLRRHPQATRSSHPILSFAGLNAANLLASQSMTSPLAPLENLEKAGGWVVLLGVDHTVNTSIHVAERLAGRATFVRWALTPRGVLECSGFPGCSAGFDVLSPDLERYTRTTQIGKALVRAVPLQMLFKVVRARLQHNPLALLCDQPDCGRCEDARLRITTPPSPASEISTVQ